MGYSTDIPSGDTFDLSQNKSLRGLEIPMFFIRPGANRCPFTRGPTFQHALSTITSPTFSTITITYQCIDFPLEICDPPAPPHILSLVGLGMAERHRTVFKFFQEMREIRDFELVLCADINARLAERAVRELEWAIKTQWVPEGGSDNFSSQPSVTCIPRGFFPAPGEVPIDSPCIPVRYPWAPSE